MPAKQGIVHDWVQKCKGSGISGTSITSGTETETDFEHKISSLPLFKAIEKITEMD